MPGSFAFLERTAGMGVYDVDFLDSRMDHDDVGLHPYPGSMELERASPASSCIRRPWFESGASNSVRHFIPVQSSSVVSGGHGQLLDR